jgi:NTP pyrophosphatase (non-canonical NTP hydrolase)
MFAIGDDQWPGLSKLSEEAGEVVQVIGKLMGTHGKSRHWDGTDLRQRLIEEIADVIAACELVIELNDLEGIEKRKQQKLALFHEWHDKQTANHLLGVTP